LPRPVSDEVVGVSYLEALQRQLAQFEAWNARPDKNPKDSWLPGAIADVKRAIESEIKSTKAQAL